MGTQVESRNRYTVEIVIRVTANIVVAVGFFLLIRILYNAASGTLAKTVFESCQDSLI